MTCPVTKEKLAESESSRVERMIKNILEKKVEKNISRSVRNTFCYIEVL
jgi:hypothetical protein